jgi:hypothetical protein
MHVYGVLTYEQAGLAAYFMALPALAGSLLVSRSTVQRVKNYSKLLSKWPASFGFHFVNSPPSLLYMEYMWTHNSRTLS